MPLGGLAGVGAELCLLARRASSRRESAPRPAPIVGDAEFRGTEPRLGGVRLIGAGALGVAGAGLRNGLMPFDGGALGAAYGLAGDATPTYGTLYPAGIDPAPRDMTAIHSLPPKVL
jgi:hypothetical protein